MKTVFLVRHAKSSWDSPNLRDVDRALNDAGFKTAEKMADYFLGLKIKPDKIMSSPAKRAFTTATFFAKSLKYFESDILLSNNIYEALMTDILQLIHHLPEEINTVMIFGHNPTFTNLANYFSTDFIPNVPTCGILQIDSQVNTWEQFNNLTARLTANYFPKEVL